MTPVLYSFRRCPYAMRARLAVASSGQTVELREVLLRDKPPAFLEASASGTVPCLVISDGVIDESLDIMKWALVRDDPGGWLKMPEQGHDWIAEADGPFKDALDRAKYGTRYSDSDPEEQRRLAAAFLTKLDQQIDGWIFARPTLADYAILPFIRQFAFIDKSWFDKQPWPDLHAWLDRFLTANQFGEIMVKYPQWKADDPPIYFP